ncbi:hypothetical protein [Urechidicola croceus]|uniref:PsbP C-terminal domain-containing protein n=1 Tax=Urechidicola croceus TaxID=1850246 RepID=A0A1D8P5L9_9FLAO|nr:hypothetical protein [Urechidicola croceus]AOW19844.1 hypothetical protein LPB138_03710 [Urechidicola croceus]
MKFKVSILLLFLITFTSCAKKTLLEQTINCSGSASINNSKVYKDIKKNFTIKIPKDWKTQFYYDNYQSDISSADTTKQLTKTFILNTSSKQGELILDRNFESTIKSKNKYEIINSQFENILNKPSYWYIAKGKKNNFEYQNLNLFIQTSVDTYLEIKTEVYGNENINERLCKAISIIKTIEFI